MLTDEIAAQAKPTIGTEGVGAGVHHIAAQVEADESVTNSRAEGQVSGITGNRKISDGDHLRQLRSSFQIRPLEGTWRSYA